MKRILCSAMLALLCAACASGGSGTSSSGAGSGRITMYGTIDEGVSYHN